MRLYVCGQKYFGRLVFEALRAAGHEVVGGASPGWRNERLAAAAGGPDDVPDHLAEAVRAAGLPWAEARAFGSADLPAGTDAIVCAHAHNYISRKARGRARLGALGYHPSLLPLHRGRDAVRWAVRLGERVAGGSTYWMDDGIDTGPVCLQDWCFVRPGDTAKDLWRRDLQPMGVRLLLRSLEMAARGVVIAAPQDPALATWEPALDAAPVARTEVPALGPAVGGAVVYADRERGLAAARAAMYGIGLLDAAPSGTAPG